MMKILILTTVILFWTIQSFGANGCRVVFNSIPRVYITPTTRCTNCPTNAEPYTNGSNYIIFSDAATECNTSQYSSPSVQYVKIGQIPTRTTAFNNSSCFTTNGTTFSNGTAVTYTVIYNCPLDNYAFLLLLPLMALGTYFLRKVMVV